MDSAALPHISQPQLDWMQHRRGKGASILPRALRGWEKTPRPPPWRRNRKDRYRRSLVKLCKSAWLCGMAGAKCLVPEVADTREQHGQPQPVGGFDDLRIALRTAGLNDCGGSRLSDFFDPIGEREESVRGGNCSLQRQLSLHGADLGGIDAAHLSRAYADGLTVARIDDGVGLHV